jgi:uncharacterized membrane protein YdjX (TVP38/TMEM64 family)
MEIGTIATVIGTGITTVTLVYQIMRNFKDDVNKNFEKHERRFEKIDQRLFLLCLGKDLPSILKAEREEK